MTLQEAMQIAFKNQVEVFFDIGCGFVKSTGSRYGGISRPTWVYFYDLIDYEKAFRFCISKSIGQSEADFEDNFEFQTDRWFPKD